MKKDPFNMSYEERLSELQITAMHDVLIFPDIQRVFAYLCDAATDYHDAANVNSVKRIAQFTGISKYSVKRAIKALVTLGLVERTSCGFPWRSYETACGTEWDEPHPPVNGFGLTDKGYKSNTFKKASEMLEEYYRRACEETDKHYEEMIENYEFKS